MEVHSSVLVVVLAFLATCCAGDIFARRIPNVLSASMLVVGLVLNAMWFGASGFANSVLGVLLVVAVMLGPFALGGIGGGDVKMMAAVGALLGPFLALAGLGMGMALGGVLMTIHLLRLGRFREKLAATAGMIRGVATTRSVTPLKAPGTATDNAVSLPYSVPLGLGTVTAIALLCRG